MVLAWQARALPDNEEVVFAGTGHPDRHALGRAPGVYPFACAAHLPDCGGYDLVVAGTSTPAPRTKSQPVGS